MSEKKLTVKQLEAQIRAIDEMVGLLKDRVTQLNAEKRGLQAQKRRQTAEAAKKAGTGSASTTKKAATTKKTTTPAKTTTTKKTTTPAKSTAAKKTTTRKTTAKQEDPKDENLLGGVLDSLKDAGFDAEDLLKSLLGGDKK